MITVAAGARGRLRVRGQDTCPPGAPADHAAERKFCSINHDLRHRAMGGVVRRQTSGAMGALGEDGGRSPRIPCISARTAGAWSRSWLIRLMISCWWSRSSGSAVSDVWVSWRLLPSGVGNALIGRKAVTFCSWYPVIAMVGVDRFVDRPSVQTVQSGPSAARLRGIRAASAHGARGRTSHNPPVVGSSPTRPTVAELNKNSKIACLARRRLADPVHLDDDHAFAADVGQVAEHQRASLDGAQPWRLACEIPPSRKIIDSRTVSSSAT